MLTAASAAVAADERFLAALPEARPGGKPACNPPPPRAPAAARCLFGRPEPGAAARLLAEQLALERRRLLWRLGLVDVAGGVAALADLLDAGGVATANVPARRPRPAPYHHRQSSVKDYFKVQKAAPGKKLEAGVKSVDTAPTKAAAD